MYPETELQAHLDSIDACSDAREWAADKTVQEAWESCDRPDWLLWWAGHTDTNKAVDFVRLACLFARSALTHVPEGELRPLLAIQSAENWCGNPTLEAAAWAAAEAARAAARAARAAEAAWAAAAAARSAVWAARAAEAAAEAAARAVWTTEEAAAWAAHHCQIIREHLQIPFLSK